MYSEEYALKSAGTKKEVSETHNTTKDKTVEYKSIIEELKAQMESSSAAKDVIIEGLEKKVEYWKGIADNDNQKVMELKAALNDSKEQAKKTALTNLALGIKVNVLEEQLDEKTKHVQDLQTEYNELLDDYCILKEEITPYQHEGEGRYPYMIQVTIADDRPSWMRNEDKWAICFNRCPLYKKCSSHHGKDCKKLGGNEIPKIKR